MVVFHAKYDKIYMTHNSSNALNIHVVEKLFVLCAVTDYELFLLCSFGRRTVPVR